MGSSDQKAMVGKRNNILANAHFHKDWKRRVRTWFNQPARKERRQNARKDKAAAIAPRPAGGALRPAVRCQTARYNIRVRAGRGFTADELKGAGFSVREAHVFTAQEPDRAITAEEKKHSVFQALRMARANAKLQGARVKKAKDAAEAAKNAAPRKK